MISINRAHIGQSNLVARLVYDLLYKLFPDFQGDFPLEKLQKSAFRLLCPEGGVWSYLAFDEKEKAVGMININRCAAIYAGGEFGEITEMYVHPDYRSQKVGELLIAQAKAFSKTQSWGLLEVGAPAVNAQ
jgi:GNAT superfamily N-acetyltransferase